MNRWVASGWKLPALSGLLLLASYYLPLLIPNLVAFVPLLYWLDAQATAGGYSLLRAGVVLGLVTHLGTLHFLLVLTRFSWLAVLLWFGFALALALRLAVTTLLLGWLRRRTGLSWALLLPACWLPLEWLQGFGDLRMTGDHLAHTMTQYPFLIQFADLAGHYGVGAFMLVVNGLLYEVLLGAGRSVRIRAAAVLALLAFTVLGYDLVAWFAPRPAAETIRVALVQPDIALSTKMDVTTEAEQRARLERLTRVAAAERPDLVVWPETARPGPVYHWLERPGTFAMPEVQALARALGIAMVVGVEYVRVRSAEDYDLYNAALAVDRFGGIDPHWVAKVYLVPFAEALPFRGWLGPWLEGRGGEWRWITGGFMPGPSGAVLDVAGAKIGVLVCYEQLFPDLARGLRNAGAELQVVVTNDAWFGRTPFQRFQADVLRLRAIENRSPFVRVANTGISGFVDRYGRYTGRTALFEEAVRVADVRRAGPPTFYCRFGDLAVWAALLGLLGCIVAARRSSAV